MVSITPRGATDNRVMVTPKPSGSTAGGIAKTFTSTLREIPEGLVKAGSGLASWEADKVAALLRFLGADEETVKKAETFRDEQWSPEQIEGASNEAVNAILPQGAEAGVKEWTQHQPQGLAEEGTAAITGFLPSLLTKNPQGMSGLPAFATKAMTRVLAPATAYEAAGQTARELAPEYETVVRFITGVIVNPSMWKSGQAQAAARQVSNNPGAMDALRRQVIADYGNTPEGFNRARQALTELGLEGVLPDIGPNLKQGAQQIYAKPGPGKEAIHEKLTSRDEGYGDRFEQDVRTNVGPRVDEDLMRDALQLRMREGGRKQRESHPAQVAPVDLTPIVENIDTMLATEKSPKIRSALTRVRKMLHVDKMAPDDPEVTETASEPVLSARQAIGEMLYEADGTPKTGLGPKESQRLKDLYAQLNEQLDPANPTLRAADAEIEQVGKEERAFDVGKKDVLKTEPNTAISPEQFARDWDALGPAEKTKMREGLTAKIDAIRGTTANERAALKRIVLGEGKWNHQKIAQIIGQEEADNLVRGMKREATFQQTKSDVLHGSKTAQTQTFDTEPGVISGAKEAVDRMAAGGVLAGGAGVATGLAISPIKAGLTAIGDVVTSSQRAELGRLMASGQPRDIVNALELLERAPRGRGSLLQMALLARQAQQQEEQKRQGGGPR